MREVIIEEPTSESVARSTTRELARHPAAGAPASATSIVELATLIDTEIRAAMTPGLRPPSA